MYASLIGAGVSQLYDLFRSRTPPPDPQAASTDATTASAPTAATTGTGRVGALNADLNTLLLDVQSGGAKAADPTATAGNDLQSASSALQKAGGSHGRHHRHADAGAQNGANPHQSVAASLLAYTKGQGLAASQGASTSLTA